MPPETTRLLKINVDTLKISLSAKKRYVEFSENEKKCFSICSGLSWMLIYILLQYVVYELNLVTNNTHEMNEVANFSNTKICQQNSSYSTIRHI